MKRFFLFLFAAVMFWIASDAAFGISLLQSSTQEALVFLMIDSTDHISAKTGLAPTVTLSKAGAAFGSPTGAVTEIANGWYKVAGNATDTGTLGPLILHATGTGADPADILFEVVAWNPQDAVRAGLTALPNAAAEASGGLYTRGTGAGQINQAANGQIDVNAMKINSVSASSVTTINANIGTTQPINFTGTAGSALAKSDTIDVGGTAQTARDLGASVLLSSGTGTGQISLSSGAVTVGTNNDKTGYSLSVTPPTAATIASAVWQDTTAGDFTTALSIGKSVLNGVTLGTGLTINGYTGNTVQTGDAYARVGLAGAGLTALGDTRIANLDGTVTSRMATYTQPTGFLAATFPGTVASTTNITAGTITTTTNLTNNNDKTGYSLTVTPPTAAAIATATWQDTTAGDFTTALSIGKSVLNGVALGTGLTINGYTGNTVQTGDSFGRIGAAGAGLTALGDTRIANLDAAVSSRSTYAGTDTSGTTTLLSRLTSGRATGLDNLDATVSSRGTSTLTAANVWDLAISGHTTAGTTGAALNAASAGGGGGGGSLTAADVWAYATRSLTDKTGFSLTSAYDPAKVDPWSVTLPSTYTGQKSGYLLWKAGNKP